MARRGRQHSTPRRPGRGARYALPHLDSGEWLAGSEIFGDDDALVSAATLAGEYVLVGDNSLFSGVPNRVGVAAVGLEAAAASGVLSPVEDPFALWAPPDGSKVLVSSGFGDELLWLEATGDPAEPFANRGVVRTSGTSVALPGTIVGMRRGSLKGLAVVSENTGLRLVDLSGAEPEDRGFTSFGSGLDQIPGALGVAP